MIGRSQGEAIIRPIQRFLMIAIYFSFRGLLNQAANHLSSLGPRPMQLPVAINQALMPVEPFQLHAGWR